MADLFTPLPWTVVANDPRICVRGTETLYIRGTETLYSLVHTYLAKGCRVHTTIAENLELADAETIVKAMGVYIEGQPSDRTS